MDTTEEGWERGKDERHGASSFSFSFPPFFNRKVIQSRREYGLRYMDGDCNCLNIYALDGGPRIRI